MAKKLVVGRHGKTNKAMIEGFAGDWDRTLTDQGELAATERRKRLRYPIFDRIAASPAPRAVRTAELMAEVRESRVRRIPECYIDDPTKDPDAKVLDDAFVEYGYADLATYMKSEKCGAALRRKAESMNEALYRWIYESAAPEHLLFVGHAVYSPAMLWPSLRGGKFEDALMDVSMPEAGCFEVTFEKGLATRFKVYPD